MNRTLDRRYEDDSKFRMLVDHIEAFLSTTDFTTTDMREALLLAQIRHEMRHPRPVVFSADLTRQLESMMKKERS